MSRVFALSHRRVYNLFRQWGFQHGPTRADGHMRMVWPETGQVVQIMPPNRSGTGEKGNRNAIQKASVMLGVGMQEFLAGPRKSARTESYSWEEIKTVAEEAMAAREKDQRVQGVAVTEAAMMEPEDQMETVGKRVGRAPGSGFPQDKGITKAVLRYMRVHAGEPVQARDVVAHVEAMGFEAYPRTVFGILGHQAEKRTQAPIVRVRPGVYMHLDEAQLEAERAAKEPIARTPVPTPFRRPDETTLAVAAVSSLNGSAPSLLSKVSSLDGGRLLYEGDDGQLYLVAAMRRLDID